MLEDKRLLITGVVNDDSIAHAVAEKAMRAGAEVILTAYPRDRALTEAAAAALPVRPEIVELDVTAPADVERLREHLEREWGGLDGALHAVAFAPRDALAGDFLAAGPEGVNLAFQTSAFSFATIGALLKDLAPEGGGSVVGLDFDAAGAWPVYNWMGVCKAALESVNRYLARDLGPCGIRSNLVAAGPLNTRAAGGIPAFQRLLDAWESQSPMPWNADDPEPVADTVCFLFSDLARAITGEILHVDGGYHAMAGSLRPLASREEDVGGVEADDPIRTQRVLPGTSLDRLARAFADIDSYGVVARVLSGDDPVEARRRLQREIQDRHPGAVGSCVFWLAAERDCFADDGTLERPLRLHCSAEESAQVARNCLVSAGFTVRESGELTLEVMDPGVEQAPDIHDLADPEPVGPGL